MKDMSLREKKSRQKLMEKKLEGEFDTNALYALYDMKKEKYTSGFFSPTDNLQSAITLIIEILDDESIDIDQMYMVPMFNSTTGDFTDAISIKELLGGIE